MKYYVLDDIDFPLLAQQKALLEEVASKSEDDLLWGLVHLIDSLQDEWEKD